MPNVHGAHGQRQQVVPPCTLAALEREREHLLARVEQDAKTIRKERRQQMMKGRE